MTFLTASQPKRTSRLSLFGTEDCQLQSEMLFPLSAKTVTCQQQVLKFAVLKICSHQN